MTRPVRWLGTLTLALLLGFGLLVFWNQAVFAEYSHDFGSLSQARFQALNARMDALSVAARIVFIALALADLSLVVASARSRAFLVLVLSVLLGVALGGFLLLSLASVSASMVG